MPAKHISIPRDSSGVQQKTENRCVAGSNPALGIEFLSLNTNKSSWSVDVALVHRVELWTCGTVNLWN